MIPMKVKILISREDSYSGKSCFPGGQISPKMSDETSDEVHGRTDGQRVKCSPRPDSFAAGKNTEILIYPIFGDLQYESSVSVMTFLSCPSIIWLCTEHHYASKQIYQCQCACLLLHCPEVIW